MKSSAKASSYPQDVSVFEDLAGTIRDYVLTGHPTTTILSNPSATVVTQGSCFARNLAKSLARMGSKVAHLNVNEVINTTMANALFFEYAFGEQDHADSPLATMFGQMMSPAQAREFRDLVASCSAFVLTIGVAPCWFIKGTQKLVLSPDKRRMADFEMRTTTPSWNAANINRVIRAIHAVNPAVPIFLTLSPAPLNRSFEFPSTVVADCLSKSVLRVAIHEVLQAKLPNVHYWPSFEVVRWVGSHLVPVFGAEDRHPRHVSNFVVDEIVKAFIQANGGTPATAEVAEGDYENTGPFALAKNF
jgi:hypothetical protein